MLTHTDQRGGFLLLALQPPKKVHPKEVRPRELIFVVDTSGSQKGFPLETSKAIVRKVIQELRGSDTFNVIRFANATEFCWGAPVGNTPENRTKGLEFDYVVLPQCDDSLVPYLKGEPIDIFDKAGIVRESQLSSKLESERRLFYVALTRARKGVLIGASMNPSRFLEEIHIKDTEPAMRAIQHLANGDTSAARFLKQIMQKESNRGSLLSNLIEGYLPDMGQQALALELRQEWRSTSTI